jgi:uncharacterized radical SAM superfamily Fe-S cluster-containing enzyme
VNNKSRDMWRNRLGAAHYCRTQDYNFKDKNEEKLIPCYKKFEIKTPIVHPNTNNCPLAGIGYPFL